MEQATGSGDRASAEHDTSPLELLDTPARKASSVLQQLYAESIPAIEDVAMDSTEEQPEESIIDPSDMHYQNDLRHPSSIELAERTSNHSRIQPLKSGLDQYQKHIYTPRSTRSMTQPSRVYTNDFEFQDQPFTDTALSTEPDVPQIQAFAKLEFDDGEFYMNTYSVELGRDLQSARQVAEKTSDSAKRARTKRKKRSASSGDASHIPRKFKREHNRSHPSSVVSECGGIIAVDHSDHESFGSYHSKKPASTSSSSQQMSRKSSMLFAPNHTDYQSLAMASLMGPDALRHGDGSKAPVPAPESCPLIPIHPPAKRLSPSNELAAISDAPDADIVESSVGTYKTISRKHVRIAFNFEKHLFEMHVLGRNGAYVDEEYCPCGDVRALVNGSIMQIGGVRVKFLLPEVAPGETGADRNRKSSYASGYSQGSEERSSADDNGIDQPNGGYDSEGKEDSDIEQRSAQKLPKPKARSKNKGKSKEKLSGKLGNKITEAEETLSAPKRKGPGRPPKNGVMSKREMGLLAKQAKEDAKVKVKKEVDGEIAPAKGKISKTVNEKTPEAPLTQPNGKRKYTKRKSKADFTQELQETRESTEHTESVAPEQILPPKPPKEKKPPKPPRSPSPFIDRNSLTEEQLAKPTQSYVVLIHEALSESEKGPMSLNQIYRAIAHKYPYFKFVVTTVGWQSSIRHNLLQHEAFEKTEREGKGWMWGLKEGVSIEKEKKRRPTPPPPQSHAYYPPPNIMQHQYGYYPGVPLPPNNQNPYPPQYGPPPQGMPPHGLPHPYTNFPQGYYPPPLRPNGLPLPLLNATKDNSSTYQSPYESTAPKESSQPNIHQDSPSQQPEPDVRPSDGGDENSASPYAPSARPTNPTISNSTQETRRSSPIPPHLDPEARKAVDRFKAYLKSSIDDKVFADHLLTSASNRVFGLQQYSSLPGHGPGLDEHPQELSVMQALRQVLSNLTTKVHSGPQNQDGDSVKPEQAPANGSLTPAAAANELVDGERAIKASPQPRVEDEASADTTTAAFTPMEIGLPQSQSEEHRSREATEASGLKANVIDKPQEVAAFAAADHGGDLATENSEAT